MFFRRFQYIFRTLFSLGVSVCTHARQVEHQRCSRTGRVQKYHKILRKNTIINEHPVSECKFVLNQIMRANKGLSNSFEKWSPAPFSLCEFYVRWPFIKIYKNQENTKYKDAIVINYFIFAFTQNIQ